MYSVKPDENVYRLLIHSLPTVGVLLFDRDLRYLLVDGAQLDRHFYDPSALVGQTLWEALPPERAAFFEPFYRAALAGETQTLETEYRRQVYLNHFVPVADDSGAIVAGMVIAENITERTAQLRESVAKLRREVAERSEVEAALRASQRFTEQIAAVSPVVKLVYDLSLHRVVYTTARFTELLGHIAPDFPQIDFAQVIPWLDADSAQELHALRASLAELADDAIFESELRIRSPDGAWRWLALRGSVFTRTPQGAVEQVLVALIDVTARRQAEEQLRQHHGRLVEAQEAIRAHLARELHDEIGQALTGLNFVLETALHAGGAAIEAQIRSAQALVNDLTTHIRALSHDLHPAILDDLGLLAAVIRLVGRYTEQTGVQVRVEHAELPDLPGPVAITAYRVAQEALTNVARHAHTKAATLQIWVGGGRLYIQVTDAGVGFDVDAALEATTTRGLAGMRERVRLLGGLVTIESSRAVGTRVVAELPLRDTRL